MRIIIFGLAGAGKDTVAEMLLEHLPITTVTKFAKKIKETALAVFGEGFDERDVKEVNVTLNLFDVYGACGLLFRELWQDPQTRDAALKKCCEVLTEYDPHDTGFVQLSPRKFQQLLGTEIVRGIEDAAWVNATREETTGDGTFIISDGRFENEIFSTEDILLYVFRTMGSQQLKDLGNHSSEAFNLMLYHKAVTLDTSTNLEHNGKQFYIIDNISDFVELKKNVADFAEFVL